MRRLTTRCSKEVTKGKPVDFFNEVCVGVPELPPRGEVVVVKRKVAYKGDAAKDALQKKAKLEEEAEEEEAEENADDVDDGDAAAPPKDPPE